MEERLIQLLRLALNYDATDIHFVSQYSEMTIEMRVDGYMRKIKSKPEDIKLVRYLKYLANLDANKLNAPQTGQFEMTVDDNLVSLRFAVIESTNMTSAVLRVLSSKEQKDIQKIMSVKDASEKLEAANDYYRGQVRNLFTQINRLSNGCGDNDNDPFIKRILSYKDNMLKISVVIDCFIAYLNKKVEHDRITVPVVDDVNNLRAINQNLDETLSGVSKIMLELHNEWKDTEGEAIVTKFQKLANRFIDESETIEQYARFLDWYFLTREDNND